MQEKVGVNQSVSDAELITLFCHRDHITSPETEPTSRWYSNSRNVCRTNE